MPGRPFAWCATHGVSWVSVPASCPPTSLLRLPRSILVGRILGALALGLIAWNSLNRAFDVDEIEAMHTAWKIARGEQIYVDFFQHHHPLLYHALQPFVLAFSGAGALIAGRIAIFAVFSITLLVAALLARELFGPVTAERTVVLLLATPFFVTKAIEVRPDVPMTLFALIGVWATFRGLGRRSRRWSLLGGIAFGVAFAFLQKAAILMFVALAVVAAREAGREEGLRRTALFAAGLTAPPLLLVGWMAMRGALPEYLFWSFLFLPGRFVLEGWNVAEFLGNVRFLGATSAIPALLFLIGVVRGLRSRRHREAVALFALPAIAFVVVGRHHPQYYLPLVPLAMVFAARGLEEAFGRRDTAISLALMVAFLPALGLYATAGDNRGQLERIRYVERITDPDEPVLDPRPSFNIARPDLDFFWFNVQEGGAMHAYRDRYGYAYDPIELVERHRPKVIHRNALDDPDHPTIARWYRPAPGFADLLVRVREPRGSRGEAVSAPAVTVSPRPRGSGRSPCARPTPPRRTPPRTGSRPPCRPSRKRGARCRARTTPADRRPEAAEGSPPTHRGSRRPPRSRACRSDRRVGSVASRRPVEEPGAGFRFDPGRRRSAPRAPPGSPSRPRPRTRTGPRRTGPCS